MNKALDILRRLASGDNRGDFFISNELLKEIEAILAQPEQTEQEPVAWKVIDGTNGGFMFSRVKPMERTYKYDVVIPLYLAPPTREPFGPEERQRISKAYSTRAEQLAFEEGIIFAKNLYNIGGEPLSNEQKRLGAIAIKQREAHGFGVGNEHDH